MIMDQEELLTEGTNSEQEENLEQIEEVEIESLDELDEVTEEVIEEEPQEQVNLKKDAPKLLKERKQLKSENQTLKDRIAELEIKAELGDLKSKYGDIDVDALKEFKAQPQYTGLPLEDTYLLWKAKQPKEEMKSKLGMVGTRGTPSMKYITMDKLSALPQAEYNRARDLIKEGKLFIKH